MGRRSSYTWIMLTLSCDPRDVYVSIAVHMCIYAFVCTFFLWCVKCKYIFRFCYGKRRFRSASRWRFVRNWKSKENFRPRFGFRICSLLTNVGFEVCIIVVLCGLFLEFSVRSGIACFELWAKIRVLIFSKFKVCFDAIFVYDSWLLFECRA